MKSFALLSALSAVALMGAVVFSSITPAEAGGDLRAVDTVAVASVDTISPAIEARPAGYVLAISDASAAPFDTLVTAMFQHALQTIGIAVAIAAMVIALGHFLMRSTRDAPAFSGDAFSFSGRSPPD